MGTGSNCSGNKQQHSASNKFSQMRFNAVEGYKYVEDVAPLWSHPHESKHIFGVKLGPRWIFLSAFLSKRLLHAPLCSLLKHIWLTGARSVIRWLISFRQRGANGEGSPAERPLSSTVSAMTSGLGELGRRRSAFAAQSAVSSLSKRWLLHFQRLNLCKQSLFSLSFKLIRQTYEYKFPAPDRERRLPYWCQLCCCVTLQEK